MHTSSILSLYSTSSLVSFQITISSENSIVHGGSLLTSFVSLSIIAANKNRLNADPWCSPTLTLKLSVVPTFLLHTSPLFRFPHTYPVQVAHTFPPFLIFSYSTTALPAEPCHKLPLGPRIHKVALFNLPCTFPSTFLRQTWHQWFPFLA